MDVNNWLVRDSLTMELGLISLRHTNLFVPTNNRVGGGRRKVSVKQFVEQTV